MKRILSIVLAQVLLVMPTVGITKSTIRLTAVMPEQVAVLGADERPLSGHYTLTHNPKVGAFEVTIPIIVGTNRNTGVMEVRMTGDLAMTSAKGRKIALTLQLDGKAMTSAPRTIDMKQKFSNTWLSQYSGVVLISSRPADFPEPGRYQGTISLVFSTSAASL
ncbi:MAG: hypothetical protein EON54_25925 [Alcaligenaceae bacterium]|nr:MAG: hypothetical protein EON54_25925 [Alcaligenaceae bacterium]